MGTLLETRHDRHFLGWFMLAGSGRISGGRKPPNADRPSESPDKCVKATFSDGQKESFRQMAGD